MFWTATGVSLYSHFMQIRVESAPLCRWLSLSRAVEVAQPSATASHRKTSVRTTESEMISMSDSGGETPPELAVETTALRLKACGWPWLLILLHATLQHPAAADNWPAWNGPHGSGVSREKDLPLRWSATENVRWKALLPGRGNSSPIVWGQRVFLTQAIENESRRTVLCFDLAIGRQLWQSGATYRENEETHEDNPYCAASPVTDGERVIAWFGSAGVFCFDFAGKELWRRDLGKQNHWMAS